MKYLLYISSLLILLSSCQKEDDAITLPPPGNMQQMVAVLGSSYDNQVYVSLANKSTFTSQYRNYDLSFETLNGQLRVWTNSGKVMLAARTGSFDMTTADSTGLSWWVDNEQHHADSSAIGNWWLNTFNGESEVFILDRGQSDFSGANRYRKFQILNAGSSTGYTVLYSLYDNTDVHTFTIPRDTNYSVVHFSFDNNGQLVNQAPPKEQWDFVFTKYTHVYFDYAPGNIFRNYPVVGVQLNVWDNVKSIQLQKDTFPNYMPFEEFNYSNVSNYPWTSQSDIIGYNWKYYDFNNSRFYVYPTNYFVVCDRNGIYYKLRFLDFYDHTGIKGTVTFEFQRI